MLLFGFAVLWIAEHIWWNCDTNWKNRSVVGDFKLFEFERTPGLDGVNVLARRTPGVFGRVLTGDLVLRASEADLPVGGVQLTHWKHLRYCGGCRIRRLAPVF
ncbi:hypothetical protein MTP99_017279 [Tenebrio molitor]|jgi:hypothetical protein|nr:hypothetical protein MTP99_017279 [Tenebrio molitor]